MKFGYFCNTTNWTKKPYEQLLKEAGIESIKNYTRIKTTWYNSSDKPMADPFTMG